MLTVYVHNVKPGDIIGIGATQHVVQFSEPYNDSVWHLEVQQVGKPDIVNHILFENRQRVQVIPEKVAPKR